MLALLCLLLPRDVPHCTLMPRGVSHLRCVMLHSYAERCITFRVCYTASLCQEVYHTQGVLHSILMPRGVFHLRLGKEGQRLHKRGSNKLKIASLTLLATLQDPLYPTLVTLHPHAESHGLMKPLPCNAYLRIRTVDVSSTKYLLCIAPHLRSKQFLCWVENTPGKC
eukprot:1152143-Pelagomonas_calceolata.AAC.1